MPAFRLARDGAQLPLSSYTDDIPWRPGRFSQTADVDRVGAEYAQGATIILQALHLHWHPAALYCRELEIALGWPVQANAYLTPTSAQGFSVHHDTHDVFVLQVAGSKRWRIYEPVVELPLKDQRWTAETGPVGPAVAELTVQPGDTLFIPRGWPHEAAAAEDESLHLTAGVRPPTRVEALRDALDGCAAEDVEFRRSLRAGEALPAGLLDRLQEQLRPEAVAARARRRFVDSRRPILDRQLSHLRAVESLGAGDEVERRPTVIADLELTEAGVSLRFEGKEIVLPASARAAVAAARDRAGAFTAADLPGPLDRESRLVLVRRLIREGFLRPVAP